jgi:hypothetical protein
VLKVLISVRLAVTLPIVAAVAVLASAAHAAPSYTAPVYTIVSEDSRDAGAVLSVRIETRVGDVELKELAEAIRLRRPIGKAAVALISFYLTGAAISGPAWAEVRFGGPTTVAIKGLRREEEDAYKAVAARDPRNVVGVWLTSPPALGGMLTIYREADRRLYAEWRLRSGQISVDEVTEWVGNRGRRYTVAGGDGSYYQALWNGQLELGLGGQTLAVAERLAVERKPVPVIAETATNKTVAASGSLPTVDPALNGAAPALIGASPAGRLASKPKAKGPQTVSDLTRAAIGAF